MTFYVLCGIPGSGKSTKAKQLVTGNHTKLYCYDTIKRDSKLNSFEDTCALINQLVGVDLLSGYDVVYDAPHTKLKHRKNVLESVYHIHCKKVLIVMDTPLKECVNRNSYRNGDARLPDLMLYDFYNSFEPPSIDEGWDEIIYYGGENHEIDFRSN